ncbi:MAG: ferritin family protein [Chloroflexota bacterium]|nr:ferritin family protein [Chloroflexota bacterium]
MPDDLADLLDMAVYKEIASQALYIAAQDKTQDPAARALMKELAEEELKHSRLAGALKERGLAKRDWHPKPVPNLKISEYLTGPDTLTGAGLQETLIFAMKREQESVEFYSQMMSVMRGEDAKHLCERLVHEELKHKLKLELFYDSLFYQED